MKILYSTSAHVTGGREGRGYTDDGQLNVPLDMPKALQGKGEGTNPEQLFAVGYGACFLGALKLVAAHAKIRLPQEAALDSTVHLQQAEDGGFALKVELQVNLPGLNQQEADSLVEKAHHVCPYSKATRGNIEVELKVTV